MDHAPHHTHTTRQEEPCILDSNVAFQMWEYFSKACYVVFQGGKKRMLPVLQYRLFSVVVHAWHHSSCRTRRAHAVQSSRDIRWSVQSCNNDQLCIDPQLLPNRWSSVQIQNNCALCQYIHGDTWETDREQKMLIPVKGITFLNLDIHVMFNVNNLRREFS